MSKKKPNILKDLKRMGLIPTNKAWEQMKIVLIATTCLIILVLAIVGAIKYPIPHHYYDNMNYTPSMYSNLAQLDDISCECGNDPDCFEPWRIRTPYDYYV